MTKFVKVAIGLITRPEHLLICQRRMDKKWPLQWEFPGGKAEAGEDGKACLKRELQEELGIRAKIEEQIHHTTHDYSAGSSFDLTFFRVSSYQGELQNNVFQRITWARVGELCEYSFLEGDREFITRLVNGEWPHLFS